MAAARAAAHSAALKRPACCRAAASASASACQGSSNCRGSSDRGDSGRLKIAFPEIEMDLFSGRGIRAPELARGEGNRIELLRTVAAAHRPAVGEYMGAMPPQDHAAPAAHIARQPGVAGRMD